MLPLRGLRVAFHTSPFPRAGHNKWSKIAAKKGVNDASRAATFAKISAAISAAVRAGGPDAGSNQRLAGALDRARSVSAPKAVIERALAAGSSRDGEAAAEELFEGFACGISKVAWLAEGLTSNRKRTALALRTLCKRHGAELLDGGAVAFMFETRGRLVVDLERAAASGAGGSSGGDAAAAALDDLLSAATEADALDVEPLDGAPTQAIVWTAPAQLHAVARALEGAGWHLAEKSSARIPTVTVGVPEDEEARVSSFLQELEDLDEILAVYHNAH